MQAQTNVFPVQTQVVGQTRVAPVQTVTTTQQPKGSNGCTGVLEIILRVICTVLGMLVAIWESKVFSLGVLIAASFAVSAINEIEDLIDLYIFASDVNRFDADSYRGAAGWLIFAASTALLYHIAMIIIRCLYIHSVIEKHFTMYGVINIIFIVLFGLSFLSGGIANVVFATDNGNLHNDLCFFGSFRSDFCNALGMLVATEAASGGLSIFTMFLYMGIVCIIICTSMVETSQLSPRIDNPAQRVPLSEPAYPSVDPSQYVTPSAPNYPPANAPPSVAVSSHVTPSATVQPAANTPWYASAEPPPYEIALTLRKEYQHKPSSSDPPNQ